MPNNTITIILAGMAPYSFWAKMFDTMTQANTFNKFVNLFLDQCF